MYRNLLFIISTASLFAQASYFHKAGEGLYLDAGFAPAWRNGRSNDGLVYNIGTYTHKPEPGWLRLLEPVVYRLRDSGNTQAPGLYIRADFAPKRRVGFEVVFLGLYDWRINKEIRNNDELMGITINPYGQWAYGPRYNFQRFTHLTLQYSEHFNSYEGNYLSHMSPRYGDFFSVAWLLGLRGIRYDNKLVFSGATRPRDGYPDNVFESTLSLKDTNTFLGGQFGIDFRYQLSKHLYFMVPLKVGAAVNMIDYHIFVQYPEFVSGVNYRLTDLVNRHTSGTKVGYFFDLKPKFELHIGYCYLYLGGAYFFINGPTSTTSQLSKYWLNSSVPDDFMLYGFLLGGGFHI